MQITSALVLVLAACSSTADAGWETSSNATPYSCQGIEAAAQTATVDPAILAPWRALAGEPTSDLSWARRVHALANTKLPMLTVDERVRLQHQMLRVAQRLDNLRHGDRAPATYRMALRAVMSTIRGSAPSGSELAALGDGGHPDVEAILGPASGITERATRTCLEGNSLHVMYNGGLLAFRPLRAGTTRALVAQLVAFDEHGAPHITPLVEGMELRLGNEVSSPACVIEAAPDGTLRTSHQAELEEHAPFVVRRGGGLGCIGCHHGENTMNAHDLTEDQTRTVDIARNGQVDQLAGQLWKALTATQP